VHARALADAPGPPREELLAHIREAMSSASHAGLDVKGVGGATRLR
jgi:hypothetical protein